ncbi:ZP domain-containing protein [Caerostris darwini]|uniref:ZP domain-containing protein n=1 Tax=Caerostris darwini TaxID=1538125 RepID=A0AAV4RVE1_9ARAC|nr:ZP domain-containing protein [Caerostris darwini]
MLVYNVTCGSDLMQLTLNLTNHPASIVYLQNLKGYPGCEAIQKDNLLIFQLSLNESGVHCGVSKMLSKQTGGNKSSQHLISSKESNQGSKKSKKSRVLVAGLINKSSSTQTAEDRSRYLSRVSSKHVSLVNDLMVLGKQMGK